MNEDEVKKAVLKELEREFASWEEFYERYKEDLKKIREYEERIRYLEQEIERRDAAMKKKVQKELASIVLLSAAFLVAVAFFINILAQSSNPWLYFIGGALISAGAFSIFYLLGMVK